MKILFGIRLISAYICTHNNNNMLKKYVDRVGSVSEFAELMGISRRKMYYLISNPKNMTFNEMELFCKISKANINKVAHEVLRSKN